MNPEKSQSEMNIYKEHNGSASIKGNETTKLEASSELHQKSANSNSEGELVDSK